MKEYINYFKNVFKFSIIMFFICGLGYPLLTTAMAQLLFPYQASGSIIYESDVPIGSSLIGQNFTDEKLMSCRPSAVKYNTYTEEEKINNKYLGLATGARNYAPSNPKLIMRVSEDIDKFLILNPNVKRENLPTDLFTESGSGLDPHITVASASIQVSRLAKNTGLSEDQIINIIKNNTERKVLGIFGEDVVNVLAVNMEISRRLKSL